MPVLLVATLTTPVVTVYPTLPWLVPTTVATVTMIRLLSQPLTLMLFPPIDFVQATCPVFDIIGGSKFSFREQGL